jgi:hypothetical protein
MPLRMSRRPRYFDRRTAVHTLLSGRVGDSLSLLGYLCRIIKYTLTRVVDTEGVVEGKVALTLDRSP